MEIETEGESVERWTGRASAEGKTLSEWVRETLDFAVAPPPQPVPSEPLATLVIPATEDRPAIFKSDDGKLVAGKRVQVQFDSQAAAPSWADVYQSCQSAGEYGAEEFAEATAHIRKWPNGFKTWSEYRQVVWLDENHPRQGR